MSWKDLKSGNVVLWDDEVHVVSETGDDHVVLIPFNSSNTKAYPSLRWPDKGENEEDYSHLRVHSVKKLADTIKDYIVNGMQNVLWPDMK